MASSEQDEWQIEDLSGGNALKAVQMRHRKEQ